MFCRFKSRLQLWKKPNKASMETSSYISTKFSCVPQAADGILRYLLCYSELHHCQRRRKCNERAFFNWLVNVIHPFTIIDQSSFEGACITSDTSYSEAHNVNLQNLLQALEKSKIFSARRLVALGREKNLSVNERLTSFHKVDRVLFRLKRLFCSILKSDLCHMDQEKG